MSDICRCMQMPAFQYDVVRVHNTFTTEDIDHSTMLTVDVRCKNCDKVFSLFPATSDKDWATNILFAAIFTKFNGPINPLRDKLMQNLTEIRGALDDT